MTKEQGVVAKTRFVLTLIPVFLIGEVIIIWSVFDLDNAYRQAPTDLACNATTTTATSGLLGVAIFWTPPIVAGAIVYLLLHRLKSKGLRIFLAVVAVIVVVFVQLIIRLSILSIAPCGFDPGGL